MNWKKMILKEKYHGPPRKDAGFYDNNSQITAVMKMNHNIEELTILSKRHIQELRAIDGMIPYHIQKLQELIDEMDAEIIEQAKYGGNLKNYKPHQRKDFQAWKHGAKFRNYQGQKYGEDV